MEDFEWVGDHWVESIGIPGLSSCHFEVRHRTHDGVHFVDGIYFVGQAGTTDMLKELGVGVPRIVVKEDQNPHYDPEKRTAVINSIKNISELLVALHESAHHGQYDELTAPRVQSFKAMKQYLMKREIVIRIPDEELDEMDEVNTQLSAKPDDLSDSERSALVQRLVDVGGLPRAQALNDIMRIINEQDATGRVLNAIGNLEKYHALDFSKVRVKPIEGYQYKKNTLFTMYPWFDEHSFGAALEIGLASHQADVPLHTICKRLLGDLCEVAIPDELKAIPLPNKKLRYRHDV
ncbi:hypothetical protein A3A38_03695 [Candidatus Kaiserbacteria bacterium RIFCSPLOWO2_01_FULL_53_17]|uniref:Uncharacterized protein n=1 Tax=Candidatus Kaiserbacteria bacterium RIFCSPLOWO2_01_FULL_53_17 TaxID=1798511 RepID=A0A1F6EGG8_9BACT|nr:MAG: hypothetical protein A3A38_03695 [Candidatus Kaiserbacteria bacterium RIFCSPLOWO2_01_FULL_53_17]